VSDNSLIVALVSSVLTAVALLFGLRYAKQQERADEEQERRVLDAARALAGKGDDTRRKIEVVTTAARVEERKILDAAATEAQRDPVERANATIEAALHRRGGGGAGPADGGAG